MYTATTILLMTSGIGAFAYSVFDMLASVFTN